MHRAPMLLWLCWLAAPIGAVAQSQGHINPQSRLVQVDSNVRLEVIDWGGAGVPLVFLAGDGSTAHTFDNFAPRFTNRFHTVGITRRGFGASAGQPPSTGLDTLVADITHVLDRLALRRVILVGHSIAGEEMTRFAELYPDRCLALIYIDAAYDRTRIDSIARVQPPAPFPHIREFDTASFASIKALYARLLGASDPESDIRATNRFDANGRFLGEVTPMALKAIVASGPRKARYDRVRCPALAIYAVPDSAADVVPYVRELGPKGRAQAESLLRFVDAVIADSRSKFARFPNRTVVDLHGNHFIFLQHPEEVERAMRAFLSERHWR